MLKKISIFLICLLFLVSIACKSVDIDAEQDTGAETVPAEFQNISVEEAEDLINDHDIFLLDVRTEEEFSSGHIEEAINIPVGDLDQRLGKIPGNKKIIVYCRSGTRSRRAADILIDNGFKQVYNMEGGIIEWKNKGLSVVE
ncbi:MAG: rhodanese-like domain-containing protein [Candidatus Humimicrobiaceae bacterium]